MRERTLRYMRGRARNGMPWRTGLVVLATLNLAAAATRGPAAGTYTDEILGRCARRLHDARLGGSAGPSIDRSFRVAGYYITGRLDIRPMS